MLATHALVAQLRGISPTSVVCAAAHPRPTSSRAHVHGSCRTIIVRALTRAPHSASQKRRREERLASGEGEDEGEGGASSEIEQHYQEMEELD